MLSDDTADEKRNTDSEIEEEQDKLQREISDSVSEEMGRSESESKQEGGHAMEEKSEFRKDTTSKSNSKGEEDNRTSSTRAANVPFRKLEEVRYDEDRSDTRLEDAQDIRLSESHHMPMMHHDEQLSIFTEAPTVSVPNAVVEDAWPRKNVEYQVHLQYKAYKWTVNMSRKNLYGLWFYAKGKGLFKSGGDGRRTSRMSITRINSEGGDTPDLGKLFLVSAEKAVRPEKLQLVQRFLDSVLNVPELLSSSYVLSLLEVSASTFDEEGGYTSVMEGWLRFKIWTKRSDEEVTFSRGQCKCDNACYDCLCVIKKVSLKRNKWRWAALKSSCIAFYETILDKIPSEVILFDSDTKVERGVRRVGSATSFIVSNSAFIAYLHGKSKDLVRKWANTIRKQVEECPWSRNHKHNSFSVPRLPYHVASYAKWFVDGEDTYAEMFKVISMAKSEIFIAGWWVCPTIFLLRPPDQYPESRLDVLLKKKAEEGVHIYVQLYKEVKVALTLNSLFTKQKLRALHPNVHVIRHPDFIVKQLGMWSHHEKIVCVDQKLCFIGGLDLCFGRWDTHDHVLVDSGDSQWFPGKDYSNPRIKDFEDVANPDEDLMDRDEFPRMPWHDVHSLVIGQPARDAARHFIQRWNYTIFISGKTNSQMCILPRPDYTFASALSPKARFKKAANTIQVLRKFTGSSVDSSRTRGFNAIAGTDRPMQKSTLEVEKKNQALEHSELETIEGVSGMMQCECQVVRSASPWSVGCATEHSIQNAYLRLISESKHFIYIENQFFVSGLEGDRHCNNRIADALVNRIRRAAANEENFRVMIFMPLLPAFPGKPEAKEAYSLRGVMHWQYRSICRGEKSIYERIYDAVEDPFEYIAFFGLRAHGKSIDNEPITEEIYIHSKTMIVDDTKVIIGSANINERSLLGDRDSEIAVVYEDFRSHQQVFNGVPVEGGLFGHTFRMKLFEEHFGISPGTELYELYKDPVRLDTWFKIQEHAMKNTQIFENVFGCLPSDAVVSFADLGLDVNAPKTEKDLKLPLAKLIAKRTKKALHLGRDPDDEEDEPVRLSVEDVLASPVQDDGCGIGKALTSHRRNKATILQNSKELAAIQGHIVYFPLNFLANEELEPKYYPRELFQ